jgi:hypothetical protein
MNTHELEPHPKPIGSKQLPTIKAKMTYSYRQSKRPNITSNTTFDAIKAGERTATTRFESHGYIDYWKKAKTGDILQFTSSKGETLLTRVTQPLHKLEKSGKTDEEWSKLEGWSIEYYHTHIKPKLHEAWQIEFEYLPKKANPSEKPPEPPNLKEKPKLPGNSPYLAKDQKKSDQATCFIGRGSFRSSTKQYRIAWGKLANKKTYTDKDVVFVSAEGARTGRMPAFLEEINRACQAGAKIITDTPYDRQRTYNIGEREVERHLEACNYMEIQPGQWIRKPRTA